MQTIENFINKVTLFYTHNKFCSQFCDDDIFNVACNFVGLPCISFPIAFNKQYLPIGAQVSSKYYNETQLLKFVSIVERNTYFEFL